MSENKSSDQLKFYRYKIPIKIKIEIVFVSSNNYYCTDIFQTYWGETL
jgi:hypothetical protein